MNSETVSEPNLVFDSKLDTIEDLLLKGKSIACDLLFEEIKNDLYFDDFQEGNKRHLRYYNCLIQFLIQSRRFDELEDVISKISKGSGELESRRLMSLGILHSRQANYRNALIELLQAEKIACEIHDDLLSAQILINIGTIYASLHHYEEAESRYKLVANRHQPSLQKHTEAALFHNLGNVQYVLGKYEKAIIHYDLALDLYTGLKFNKLLDLVQVLKSRCILQSGNFKDPEIQTIKDSILISDPIRYIGHLNNAILEQKKDQNLDNALTQARLAQEGASVERDYQTQIEALQIQIACLKKNRKFEEALLLSENLQSVSNTLNHLREKSKLIELEVHFNISQKDLELQSLKKQNELSEQIHLRNKQLAEANQDLRQFAYVVSHDLKEPLRMIGAYTQLIQHEFMQIIDDEKRLYFDYVSGGVQRLDQLLDGLSNYSNLQSRVETYTVLPIQELLNAALENLDVLVNESRATVNVNAEGNIFGSRILLIILFQNLLHNALKFKLPEKVSEITITASKNREHTVLDFKDNGIGISEDQLDRIFVIFQRLNKRNQFEGTGMGLAICKKIVQMHDGNIQAMLNKNGGSIFRIRLPNQIKITSE